MELATNQPSEAGRKRHVINHRKKRRVIVTNFLPDDHLNLEWDNQKREWKMFVESANGLQIDYIRLTLPPAAA